MIATATAYVSGVNEILANLEKERLRMEKAIEKGLKQAGNFLLRESKKKVPVEFGDLKASGYVISGGTGSRTVVEVGYTAPYALWVHEAVGMILKGKLRVPTPPHKGRYWDPAGQAQAKFLEWPMRALQDDMAQIIYKNVKIQ